MAGIAWDNFDLGRSINNRHFDATGTRWKLPLADFFCVAISARNDGWMCSDGPNGLVCMYYSAGNEMLQCGHFDKSGEWVAMYNGTNETIYPDGMRWTSSMLLLLLNIMYVIVDMTLTCCCHHE